MVSTSPCALKVWRDGHILFRDAVQLFKAQSAILEVFVKRHSRALLPCVAAFLSAIRTLLPCVVVVGADGSLPIVDAAGMARSLCRLFEQFATLPSASKHAPYIIVDYLALLEQHILRDTVRTALIPGVNALIGACKQHEIDLIGAVSGDASKLMFESHYADFEKYFKYKGKA